MPTDAKLGLAVGVGLVVAVAVMSFRKDPPPAEPPPPVAAVKSSPAAVKPPAERSPVPGRPVSRRAGDDVPHSSENR